MILPDGAGRLCSWRSLGRRLLCRCLCPAQCVISLRSMTPSYLGVSPQLHTSSEDPCVCSLSSIHAGERLLGQWSRNAVDRPLKCLSERSLIRYQLWIPSHDWVRPERHAFLGACIKIAVLAHHHPCSCHPRQSPAGWPSSSAWYCLLCLHACFSGHPVCIILVSGPPCSVQLAPSLPARVQC